MSIIGRETSLLIPEPPPPEYIIDERNRGLGARLRSGRGHLCVGDGYYTSGIYLDAGELRKLGSWALEVASVIESGITEEPK
jgi:hypothetical protein